MYRNRLVKLCCEIRASEGHEILEARESRGVQTKSGFALIWDQLVDLPWFRADLI